MAEFWDKVIERFTTGSSLQKIKFGRGVVGKLAGVAVVTVAGLSYISRNLPPEIAFKAVIVTGIVAILIVVGIVAVAFGKPELAVLEGMELVNWKRVTQVSKDYTPSGELPPIPDPSEKPKLEEAK